MPQVNQFQIDTKFLEFLLNICLIISIFSFVFLKAITPSYTQIKSIQFMYILFMIFFTLFLGVVFGLFIRWYGKYKTSLFKFH